jgi:hypothetical protein
VWEHSISNINSNSSNNRIFSRRRYRLLGAEAVLLQRMSREAGPCCRRIAHRGLDIQQGGFRQRRCHSRRRTGNNMRNNMQRRHLRLLSSSSSSSSIAILRRVNTKGRMRPSSAASPWSNSPRPQQVVRMLLLLLLIPLPLHLLHPVQRMPAARHSPRPRCRAGRAPNRLLGSGKAPLGAMHRGRRGRRQRPLRLRFSHHPTLPSRHWQPRHSRLLLLRTRLGCLPLHLVLDRLCVPVRQALPVPVPMGEGG